MFNITQKYNPDLNEISINFIGEFNEQYQKVFLNFVETYEIDNLIYHPEKKAKLRPRIERKCRFCNKSMPEVKFRKHAHLLPQLMGNRHLTTDFECDGCNSFFSKYENNLANFMGLSRTLTF